MKITPGQWHAVGGMVETDSDEHADIACFYPESFEQDKFFENSGLDESVITNNARLCAEAGNLYHDEGVTPYEAWDLYQEAIDIRMKGIDIPDEDSDFDSLLGKAYITKSELAHELNIDRNSVYRWKDRPPQYVISYLESQIELIRLREAIIKGTMA